MQYYEGKGKLRYYDSPAWGELCRRVYGRDLKQISTVTTYEMELLYSELDVSPGSRILDIGCGPGYISAEIAGHYRAHVTGIDIDDLAIAHANRVFANHPLLDFQVADGNEISFEPCSFDVICFFDTLYFTGTADRLRVLLDRYLRLLKPEGKLVIFWSAGESAANETQVGQWGLNKNVPCKTFDLTQSNRSFWRRAKTELLAMKSELRREIPKTYKQVLDECRHAESNMENIYRWLYIYTR